MTEDGCATSGDLAGLRHLARKAYSLRRWHQVDPVTTGERKRIEHRRACADHAAAVAVDRVLDHQHDEFAAERRYQLAIRPPGPAVLTAIAACESRGNPRAVNPSGTYRGKYQFDYGTWHSVGGGGDPAAAPEREQDRRAAKLYRARGSQPWPVCGR